MRKQYIAIGVALLLSLVGVSLVQADGPLTDNQCKVCHSAIGSDIAATLDSGESVSVHVETGVLAGSVHAALLCTDCHREQGAQGFPHKSISASSARLFTLEMSNVCRACHEDEYEKQQDSMHAAAQSAGKTEAATCIDCHGSHNIQVPDQPRDRIAHTCARCHKTIYEQYASSVHGAALLGEENPDVPVCIDCHGVHNIYDPTTARFRVRSPRICATCHADQKRMDKYGISSQVFKTYVADYHGTTLQLFDPAPDTPPRQAVCFDCHGIHNIGRVDDPETGISMKKNLVKVCRKCHPDATANFPDAWLGHHEPCPTKAPLAYYTKIFYIVLTISLMLALILHIVLDYSRLVVKKIRS